MILVLFITYVVDSIEELPVKASLRNFNFEYVDKEKKYN